MVISTSIVACKAIAESNSINISVGIAPPYINEAKKESGFVTKIILESLKESKIVPNFIIKDWHQVSSAVDLEHHLSYWWHKTPEREKKWYFSQPIFKAEFVFLARKNVRFYWTRYDQLRPYKIGLSHIQSYGPLFDSYIQYLQTETLISDYSGIKALLKGDVDAVLIEKAMAIHLLTFFNKEEQNRLELFENKVIYEEPYYLVCAKSFSNCNYYIEVFNVGLNKVKSSGKYDKIIEDFSRGHK